MKKHYLFLAVLVLVLTACGGKATPAAPSQKLDVTDPNQPIEVKVGEEFKITVETAGQVSQLHWEVAEFLDTAVVDYVWKDFVPQTTDVKGPGWDVWRFKAVAPGTTVITLGYYRGLTDVPSKLSAFTIVVK